MNWKRVNTIYRESIKRIQEENMPKPAKRLITYDISESGPGFVKPKVIGSKPIPKKPRKPRRRQPFKVEYAVSKGDLDQDEQYYGDSALRGWFTLLVEQIPKDMSKDEARSWYTNRIKEDVLKNIEAVILNNNYREFIKFLKLNGLLYVSPPEPKLPPGTRKFNFIDTKIP